jgi:serine/threonine protein kinase
VLTRLTPHPWFEAEMLLGLEANHYPLRRVVGFGGFGAVYLTRGADGVDRVIKVLYPPHSSSSQDLQVWAANNTHFLRELHIVAHFDHPNIIKIYDTGNLFWHFDDPLRDQRHHDDRSGDYLLPFYVAEYLPDGIDQHVRDNHLLHYREVVLIGAQICDGLAALHNSMPPVIHRDLNPRNVRLTEGNRPVITDFGVARSMNPESGDVTTHFVPPDVVAPEQLKGEDPDARTDIYQVGALLFAMLTGKFPREADVTRQLEAKGIPQDLVRVIRRCLEYERQDPWRTNYQMSK